MTRPRGSRSRAMFRRRGFLPMLRQLRIRLLPVPGQAVGLAFLVTVLTAALVSAPLFVASAEAAAWDRERERLGEVSLGATLSSTTLGRRGGPAPERISAVDELDAGVAAAARSVGLETPELSTDLRNDLAATTAGHSDDADVVSVPGAAENVEIVEGGVSEDGVLVPEPLIDRASFGPGTTITLTGATGTVVLPVSGVYVTPVVPLAEFWDGRGNLFIPTRDARTGDLVSPPSAIIAPQALALSTAEALGEHLDLRWSVPLDESVGITGARATAERFRALQATLLTPDGPVAGVVADADFASAIIRTALPDALETVARTGELLEFPVRAIGIGGGAAALVLVGVWAGLRMRQRDDELRSLVARGLSPARATGDVVRESVVPVLLGGMAGGALGRLLVRELGPSAQLPAGATDGALLAPAAGVAATFLVVAVVTAVLVTRLDQVGRGQAAAVLGRVPWLAVGTAVAAVTVVPLVTRPQADAGGRVDVLTLAVPLLVTVVVAGAVGGLLPRLGARSGARLRRLPTVPYLAVRRVLAGSGTARLVVVTTAMSLSLVVYAGALASSTDRTIAAKASVATGSDVVVPLPRPGDGARPLTGDAMAVGIEGNATVVPGDIRIDVLAVQPDQVADVVRWNEGLADRPLPELMAALSDYQGDRAPVVLAGSLPDGLLEGTGNEFTVVFGYFDLPVEVVARADAFPGQPGRRPLLVADWERYAAALEAVGRDPQLVVTREIWARGDVGDVLNSLPVAGILPPPLEDVTTAAEFADRPELVAEAWSLDYLRAVALVAGALGLGGLAMHAMAQQRRRTVAALLLTRMGMTRRSSDAAAGVEIGLLAGLAALVAVAVALPSSALVLRLLDPVPTLLPEPRFAVPWTSIGAVALGVALVTVGIAVVVGRSARRATGGQVMRDAT